MIRDELGSLHSDLRLLQRAQELDKTMTEMWDDAIECEVSHHGYDEARVCPESDLVILKENDQIVTVIPETYNVTIDGKNFEDYLGDALEREE